jgi:hypothetical protein
VLLGRGGACIGRRGEQDLLLMRGAMNGQLIKSSEVVVSTAHHIIGLVLYLLYTITFTTILAPLVRLEQL